MTYCNTHGIHAITSVLMVCRGTTSLSLEESHHSWNRKERVSSELPNEQIPLESLVMKIKCFSFVSSAELRQSYPMLDCMNEAISFDRSENMLSFSHAEIEDLGSIDPDSTACGNDHVPTNPSLRNFLSSFTRVRTPPYC